MTTKAAPRRRWDVTPWPWPGDNREDKAKRVALSYRQLTFDITQGRIEDPAGDLHRLDRHWAQYGIHWPTTPDEAIDELGLDDWQTAANLAHLIHRTPADIYRWARRGQIQQRTSADGSPEYSLTSARRYLDQQRGRRTANRP
jgi:hypothetical protein